MFNKRMKESPEFSIELTGGEKGILLMSARDSINSLFNDINNAIIDFNFYPNLLKKDLGAFVTITEDNQLRGCIGYITSQMNLLDTVNDAAKQAAVNDPRFIPLTEEELPYINIEISVLSPLKEISNYDEIQIGVHGLVLEEGEYKGVLLPQVATENNYDLPQFLEAICIKSGLPSYEWETRMISLKVFTANIFSEISNRKRTHENY